MLGAIIGDIVGSRFEFRPHRSKEFDLFVGDGYKDNPTIEEYTKSTRFTDDTVMTIAVCRALLDCKDDYKTLSQLTINNMQLYGRKYPFSGYGFRFNGWLLTSNPQPYNSYGNGSAMRISAVPYFAKSIDEVKALSKIVTEVTHNHPDGIKGAEAIAVCVWMALNGTTKEEIIKYVEENYYKLDFDYEQIKATYRFNETCQGSVPQSIYAFAISNSYEDTIRTAVSMGGDADTMACISGAIAEAYYGLPEEIEEQMYKFLSPDIREVVEEFKAYKKA